MNLKIENTNHWVTEANVDFFDFDFGHRIEFTFCLETDPTIKYCFYISKSSETTFYKITIDCEITHFNKYKDKVSDACSHCQDVGFDFYGSECEHFSKHFSQILKQIIEHPSIRLKCLKIKNIIDYNFSVLK